MTFSRPGLILENLQSNARAVNEKEPSYLHKVKFAFSEGLDWFGSLFIGMIAVWPLWIGLGCMFAFYRKWKMFKTKSA